MEDRGIARERKWRERNDDDDDDDDEKNGRR